MFVNIIHYICRQIKSLRLLNYKFPWNIAVCVFMSFCITPQAWAKHHNEEAPVADSLIQFSEKHIGCKYKYAGKGPKTFDCSGFTGYVFGRFGYTLAPSSQGQYAQGEKVKPKDVKKGDLIFFSGSNANSRAVGHVGIVTERIGDSDTLRFIHASVKNGVVFDLYPGLDYYNKRFMGCRRIITEAERETEADKNEATEKNETVKEPIPLQSTTKEDRNSAPNPIAPPQKNQEDNDSLETKDDSIKEEIYIKRKNTKKEKRRNRKSKKEPLTIDKISDGVPTITHTVKKGDTMYNLSVKYKCTVEEIKKWNHKKNSTITIGEKLEIQKK